MLWDSLAYLLYLFDWNIILEQEPKYSVYVSMYQELRLNISQSGI